MLKQDIFCTCLRRDLSVINHSKSTVNESAVTQPPLENKPVSNRPMVLHARMLTGTGGGPDKTIVNSPRFLSDFGFNCKCLFYRPSQDLGFESIRQRANEVNAEIIEGIKVGDKIKVWNRTEPDKRGEEEDED